MVTGRKVPRGLQNNSALEKTLHLKRERTRRSQGYGKIIVFNENQKVTDSWS